MVEESIVRLVRTYLSVLNENGIPVAFGVVFGSQATGRTHKWSDIDLLVVSPKFDGRKDREEIHKLWIKAGPIDDRIEPIPCGEVEWREDDSRAIVEMARREGEIIYP